jgi:hypothetical protein
MRGCLSLFGWSSAAPTKPQTSGLVCSTLAGALVWQTVCKLFAHKLLGATWEQCPSGTLEVGRCPGSVSPALPFSAALNPKRMSWVGKLRDGLPAHHSRQSSPFAEDTQLAVRIARGDHDFAFGFGGSGASCFEGRCGKTSLLALPLDGRRSSPFQGRKSHGSLRRIGGGLMLLAIARSSSFENFLQAFGVGFGDPVVFGQSSGVAQTHSRISIARCPKLAPPRLIVGDCE